MLTYTALSGAFGNLTLTISLISLISHILTSLIIQAQAPDLPWRTATSSPKQ